MAVNNVSEINEFIVHKYQELIKNLDTVRKSPRALKTMKVPLIEMEVLENKPHNKIHETYYSNLHKYENTAIVLQKAKEFIKNTEGEFLMDFETDKENYTTIAIAPDCIASKNNMVYLWKSIYKKPDYIKYVLTPDGNCKIVKIISQQSPMGHKSFMLAMLFRAIEEYNSSVISDKYEDGEQARQVIRKIIVDISENREKEKTSFLNFFMKKGFEFNNDGIYKRL